MTKPLNRVIIKIQKGKELIQMKHYLFEDLESGEEFIVGAATIGEAMTVAIDEFGKNVKYRYQMTEEEAEASGLDEY